jgi:hypothetical protein
MDIGDEVLDLDKQEVYGTIFTNHKPVFESFISENEGSGRAPNRPRAGKADQIRLSPTAESANNLERMEPVRASPNSRGDTISMLASDDLFAKAL